MQQLDPKAAWLFFITGASVWFGAWLVLILPFAIFFIMLLSEVPTPNPVLTSLSWIIFSAITITPFILIYLWSRLTYHYYRYQLTDLGFRKEHGVIWKRYVTIPYDRIQNVDILRGVLARMMGLSDLQIQTAGMSGAIGAEGRLPGLSQEIAEQLRDELIQRAKQSTQQGL